MTANSHRETAKIYQFPAGGRAGLRDKRTTIMPIDAVASGRAAKVIFGSGWYHEEAIQDAEQARKR